MNRINTDEILYQYFASQDYEELMSLKEYFDLKMAHYIEKGKTESQALELIGDLIRYFLNDEIKDRREEHGDLD